MRQDYFVSGYAPSWLIANLPVYLTEFLKRRNRPRTRKNSQKCAFVAHRAGAFTIFALTMIAAYMKYTIC
jgi:hypothetical protein